MISPTMARNVKKITIHFTSVDFHDFYTD